MLTSHAVPDGTLNLAPISIDDLLGRSSQDLDLRNRLRGHSAPIYPTAKRIVEGYAVGQNKSAACT